MTTNQSASAVIAKSMKEGYFCLHAISARLQTYIVYRGMIKLMSAITKSSPTICGVDDLSYIRMLHLLMGQPISKCNNLHIATEYCMSDDVLQMECSREGGSVILHIFHH